MYLKRILLDSQKPWRGRTRSVDSSSRDKVVKQSSRDKVVQPGKYTKGKQKVHDPRVENSLRNVSKI